MEWRKQLAVYRRFVAYVYEYPDGKKGNGKGFIKVEARDGVCRIHFRLSGIYGKETLPCKIYGYVRKEKKCQGILLGNFDLAGDLIQFVLEMPEDNLGNQGYRLEDLGGIVLLTEDGIMYGTGWDEKPVRLEEILFSSKSENMPYETEAHAEMTVPEPKEPEAEIEEIEEIEEAKSEPEAEEIPVMERRSEPQSEQELEPGPEEDEIPEMLEIPKVLPDILPEIGRDKEKKENDIKAEAVSDREKKQEREVFCPFKDGMYEQCMRITPADFRMLSHPDRGLMNNNFLRYGYRKYGHVLIGKHGEKGEYILGVPGRYDRQEALMAGMFGFPYFKEAHIKEAGTQENRKFPRTGYWYRSIDAPHIDGRDGF